MKLKLFSLLVILSSLLSARAEERPCATTLPDSIFSGYQGRHHVQGIAVDVAKGVIYFSFTTKIVKTDLHGNLLGSVDGLTGHLGCLSLNPADGRVYGSIEYKDDVIGIGISGEDARKRESAFYIAVFDGDKITRPDMSPTDDNVMTTVYLADVVDDYNATVDNNGRSDAHRYGCSGIDGVAFGPLPGKKEGSQVLYVAYGIYADTARTDNDYQVLLAYDTADWSEYERPLFQDAPHHAGPTRPLCRFFVYTGNTSWGIQNLNYDPATNSLLAAVYKGIKPGFPNFTLFAIDLDRPAVYEQLKGFADHTSGYVLPLKKAGIHHPASDTYGWNIVHGATGLCSLGDGLFYLSEKVSKPEQSSILRLFRWTGDHNDPFQRIHCK